MRKIILACIIATFVFTTFSCDAPSGKVAAEPTPGPGPSPVTSISLDSGIGYIKMYSELCRKRGVPGAEALRAFTIPRADLFDLLGMDTLPCGPHISFSYSRARAYIGYTNSDQQFHLVFTPVVDDTTAAGHDTILTNAEGAQIVFDLTTPCPNTCDLSSKLYRAFDNK